MSWKLSSKEPQCASSERRQNPFIVQNLYYNKTEDYFVCPMGQHMEHIDDVTMKSDLGYESTVSRYIAQLCSGCPLRGMCYNAKSDRRVIEVNHKNNAYRRKAKELLTSERGLYHRSNRPIEAEAVFGNTKFNHEFKRFHLKLFSRPHNDRLSERSFIVGQYPLAEEGVFHLVTVGIDDITIFLQAFQRTVNGASTVLARL